jgi:epoxyqueuosine reductase
MDVRPETPHSVTKPNTAPKRGDEPPLPSSGEDLAARLRSRASDLGFTLFGVAPAFAPTTGSRLNAWMDAGFAGEMHYFERRAEAYQHPSSVLPSVRSIVMLGMPYRTEGPASTPLNGTVGRVSNYAWGDGDYHDLLRDRLRSLADLLHSLRPGCRTRGVVDTAPLLERDFARLSGLGWFGKNTLLINRRQGSFFFLAGLLTDVELPPDAPHETAHCGTCTRCLDVCPTDAFSEPYVLDARKCISYLTIELRDQPIPLDLRPGMGEWIFGCDLCQDVCPWNRKAPLSVEPSFRPQPDLRPPDLIALLEMTPEAFEERYAQTPLARPGRRGVLRNAAIALGNLQHADGVPALIRVLEDQEPLIRGAAAWALGRIGGTEALAAIALRLSVESDETVRGEIELAQRSLSRGDGGDALEIAGGGPSPPPPLPA